MVTIEVGADEIRSGKMTQAHLAEAVQAIREDGFVALRNIVSAASVATLREKLIADVAALQARPDAPYNWNTGNIQQDPPPFPPYLFRDVLVNEMAVAVTHAVLGPGVKNAYYSGNTALRSEERQPVHVDVGHLWPDMEEATPAFGLVVNLPLVDMSPENGSTEIWPGTHRDTTVSLHSPLTVPEAALARWRDRITPIQPVVSAGSLLIRDIRLWHAGMPNRTDTPRPMIAMIHWTGWYGYAETLRFPKGTEPIFAHPVLKTVAEFVERPIDYIQAPQAYAFPAR